MHGAKNSSRSVLEIWKCHHINASDIITALAGWRDENITKLLQE
jgi:hypothetical protein